MSLIYIVEDNYKIVIAENIQCICFILFLFTVFTCELEYLDISMHRQPLLHLFEKDGEVVSISYIRSRKRNCVKQQFDMPHNGVYQPPTYSLYSLTGYPLTILLNPLAKRFLCPVRIYNVLGWLLKLITPLI